MNKDWKLNVYKRISLRRVMLGVVMVDLAVPSGETVKLQIKIGYHIALLVSIIIRGKI